MEVIPVRLICIVIALIAFGVGSAITASVLGRRNARRTEWITAMEKGAESLYQAAGSLLGYCRVAILPRPMGDLMKIIELVGGAVALLGVAVACFLL
jgi:hypothetical protein